MWSVAGFSHVRTQSTEGKAVLLRSAVAQACAVGQPQP